MSNLWKEDGSFTIEASLLLPIIMFITMLLLFFCLYSYQKSVLLQVASATAERGAYTWDNSHKETTGSFAAGQYDSLYWRIGEDNLLGSLFGAGAGSGSVTVLLPDKTEGSAEDLPKVKLGQSAVKVPVNMPGEIKYTFGLTGRKVSLKLQHLLDLPVLDEILTDGGVPAVEAQSLIAEPVEFIRSVDLMRYYGAKFQGRSGNEDSGAAMKPKDASEMVGKLKK
ncbi:TadE/TadG family type IV pilus assembly protein [Paenibacillus wynnii]|uniref:Pilus assembly protein TadE n=1 Tax=Paenibacillus wynnii TaxID=268407 RepID=A0A098M919_9BACL|nr:TadE family protein [Paenibacillus wynnii]KGE19039.1 pilus assembly protein TadE [Paenibacillus wynnii]